MRCRRGTLHVQTDAADVIAVAVDVSEDSLQPARRDARHQARYCRCHHATEGAVVNY